MPGSCCGDCRFFTPQGLGSVLAERISRGFEQLEFCHRFCHRLFLLVFEGEWPEKSSRKVPDKIRQNLYNKIPNIFLRRGRAKKARAISAAISLALSTALRVLLAHSSSWEFGLRSLVDGRGNSKGREGFLGKHIGEGPADRKRPFSLQVQEGKWPFLSPGPPSFAAKSVPKRRRDTVKLPKLISENQQSYRSEIVSELIR